MIKPSYAQRLRIVTLLALLVVPSVADAKGGHSRGRFGKASAQSTAKSVTGIAPSALATPATAAAPKKPPSLPVPIPAAAPAPTPAAVIGAPPPQLQPTAPLSQPVTTTTLTAGGNGRTDTLPSSSGSSPSESAASTAGGGGSSLQDCMAFWDRDAHMTKAEWKGACSRSVHRLDNLHIESLLAR
jgi:hypothetical protein